MSICEQAEKEADPSKWPQSHHQGGIIMSYQTAGIVTAAIKLIARRLVSYPGLDMRRSGDNYSSRE